MPMEFPPAEQPDAVAGASRGEWIETYTGKVFYPLDPRPEDIDILDIAHSLSLLCRYNGHCTRFYSVAEHSVHLCRFVRRTSDAAGAVMLLHDGPEAYTSDFVRPLKQAFRQVGITAFDQATAQVERAMFTHFGMTAFAQHGLPPWVKDLDTRILVDERAAIMRSTANNWITDGLAPLGVRIECWDPRRAEKEFLTCARQLGLTDHG